MAGANESTELWRPSHHCKFFFKKMGHPRPLFRLFSVFSNKQYNSYNKSMWKMSSPSSIWRWDLNPRPLERESPPITTRPVLPPPSLHSYCTLKYVYDIEPKSWMVWGGGWASKKRRSKSSFRCRKTKSFKIHFFILLRLTSSETFFALLFYTYFRATAAEIVAAVT